MRTKFFISKDTNVQTNFTNDVLRNAAEILQRDIRKTVTNHKSHNTIILKVDLAANLKGDAFQVVFPAIDRILVIAKTELGVMYGALAISKDVLGIDDFWFWLDKMPKSVPYVEFPKVESLKMPDYHVKYRGWFVNDELLINHWEYRESNQYVWMLIFETLLRCGGNIVIPGTDTNSHLHWPLASSMGLMIAHHHAEPLGADMFSRVYPDLEASYLKHPDLFKKIWQDSIDRQKGSKILWNIGFRGQGDRPFWADDDHNYTEEDKAKVINSVIQTQYEMVKKADPDAMCSMNIYGESTGLYNEGLLKIPKDVIQIWADNGYGKMVSRRQGNDDPRSAVLSSKNDQIAQGIYYHVAFHDLQASNFLTLLQIDPHYVADQLMQVRQAGMDDLVIANTGSIKPHIFYLRLIAQTWRSNYKLGSNSDILNEYVGIYYESHLSEIAALYTRYFQTTFNYRHFEDQKAGDEFYVYTLRKAIATWLAKRDQMPEMEWLTGTNQFAAQLRQIDDLIKPHVQPFIKLATDTTVLMKRLPADDAGRLYNDLWLSIAIHTYSIKALKLLIDAFKSYDGHDFVGAFLKVDQAKKNMQTMTSRWLNNPLAKWRHFFDNDCYTNITLAAQTLATLENVIRITCDGPDEDQWERKYLMRKSDAKVMLLSNTHKAYSDDEIASRLEGNDESL
ncbi:glycosyl hydrolase 115 family protein [Lentilactobacillus diolivorans]|uniref:Glycosyl hydrolase family 115 n=1 Tax=Lentilactobacillus diolivorans TaxID=179838 RepID=A0ABQ0XEY6_9LACO|nr:glycosyl hydrolase 115 family protein [Lentilactobacillus diolivorans]GEP23913.1 hypothetical protein LDI01_15060 [Lentilactobacillus diolivorans]